MKSILWTYDPSLPKAHGQSPPFKLLCCWQYLVHLICNGFT